MRRLQGAYPAAAVHPCPPILRRRRASGAMHPCMFGHGTAEHREADHTLDLEAEARLVEAAAESEDAKKTLDTKTLDHAHKHGNVRLTAWSWRRTPPIDVA